MHVYLQTGGQQERASGEINHERNGVNSGRACLQVTVCYHLQATLLASNCLPWSKINNPLLYQKRPPLPPFPLPLPFFPFIPLSYTSSISIIQANPPGVTRPLSLSCYPPPVPSPIRYHRVLEHHRPLPGFHWYELRQYTFDEPNVGNTVPDTYLPTYLKPAGAVGVNPWILCSSQKTPKLHRRYTPIKLNSPQPATPGTHKLDRYCAAIILSSRRLYIIGLDPRTQQI